MQLSLSASIDELNEVISKEPQIACPIENYFADGLYGRKGFIPKGTVITGAKHKKQGFNILISGVIRFNVSGEIKTVSAPHVFITEAGSQKAAYAIEDCVFMTVHHSFKETEEDAVSELSNATVHELLGGKNNKQLNTLSQENKPCLD